MTEPRRTRANGRATRATIIAAAADIFAHKGYRGTTLKDVAERAGMTLPGLLHHFPDKNQLLLEVVRAREVVTEISTTRAVAELPFAQRMLLTIEHIGEVNAAQPVHQLLLTTLVTESLAPDHPLHEMFAARYRRVRAQVVELIVQAQAKGECRPDVDADAIAREGIALLDGLHLQWLLDPDEIDLASSLKTWAKRLVEELSPR